MNFLKFLSFAILLTCNNSIVLASAPQSAPTITQRKTCDICFTRRTAKNFATLSCTHSYCNGCLTELINNALLKDKSTSALRCPNQACKQTIGQADIRSITHNNQNQIEAYADTSTNEWLDSHPHAKHCPTPNCSYAFINDRQQTYTIQCPSCTQSYCSGCLVSHAKNISCAQAKEHNQIDPNTQTWLQRNTKACPGCTRPIERASGCDHMQCKKCNYEFCWNCSAPFRDTYGKAIHPSYCTGALRRHVARNNGGQNHQAIDDYLRNNIRNNMEQNDNDFKCSVCCIAGCMVIGSLTLNLYGQNQNPHQFIQNYHPRFERIGSGQEMAERHCPDFLQAGPQEQTMIDTTPTCLKLTAIEQNSNQHHTTMLKEFSGTFPHRPSGYSDAVTLSANNHRSNLAHIALAKEKCGCIQESKKMN